MRNFFPAGLTQRFLLLSVIIIFIPLLIIFAVAVSSSKDIIQKQTEEQAIQVAKVLSDKTKDLFQFKTQLLENITASDPFSHRKKTERMVTELAMNDPFFEEILLLDENGSIVYQAPFEKKEDSLTVLQSTFFKEIIWRRASFVSQGKAESGAPEIYMLVPVQTIEHGPVNGAFLARVSLTYLEKYYKKNIVSDSGRTFLFNKEGDILFDTKDTNLAGQSIARYPFFHQSILDRTGVFKGTLWENNTLVAYSPIDRLPFYAATSLPLKEANLVISSLKNVLINGFVVILLATFAFLLFSIRWVIQPIKRLTEQAASYAKGGDWFVPMLRKNDEIKTLSNTMKFMAESLRSQERHLQSILESFPFGVVTINPDGVITSINDTGSELLFLSQPHLVGKSIDELPQPFKDHFEKCKHVSHKFDGVEDDFTLQHNQGKRKVMKQSSSPLLNEKQEVIGVLTTFWDVTKVRQLERHIQRSEQLVAIGQMTAGLAHEVKNPLGTVQMASDVIETEFNDLLEKYSIKDMSSDIIQEALKDIQDEIQRLNELVRRFLQFSREHKKDETIFNLKSLLNETLHLLSHQFRKKAIHISTSYSSDQLRIKGDRSQLIQALLNIFLNAIEAVTEKGEIHVSVEEVKDKYELTIADNGIGISEQKINRIFNPFFSTKQEGTGLGLWITHDIITTNNGQIEVESELGKGTTFIISLPRHKEERVDGEENLTR
ncbi:ATP-binding protein [Cytobacillus spongiae]|uniref:PAS domain-containing sensor histidine kinase n=1 Tax=Cytobacillus spongiae TaxID=2901381 RepID=UPI001F36A952|nr:PAS domain-containing sensor histidine kinase [Cytobacillus spongiae]UII56464.1 ATP-binding protein [Cytobacillus spongiae]